jgi:uncharacterized protein
MVYNLMFPRILKPPPRSFFLFGPRGTGKSTWIRSTFPNAHSFNLLDEGLYQALLAEPGRFAAELRALRSGSLVVIDEVQRIPALLNEVHRQIEDRRLRFILCGSSARKLKKEGTNLLAGRAVRRFMHALVPEEMAGEFDLEAVLRWGSLPVVWDSEDRSDALHAYAQMYLKEEVQAEALVRNLPGFARFLPIAALFHAQVLNVSALARDAGAARNTVIGYLEVIEDTLLAFRLPAFETRLRVRERRHPKLYWADPGLPRALKRQTAPPVAEERGPLFEGFIASVLRAYRDYRGLFDEWFYWAAGGRASPEVDFLLKSGRSLIAVEVKAASRVSEGDLRGLRAVADLNGLKRRIVVCTGDRRLATADGIEIMPLRMFLDVVERANLF